MNENSFLSRWSSRKQVQNSEPVTTEEINPSLHQADSTIVDSEQLSSLKTVHLTQNPSEPLSSTALSNPEKDQALTDKDMPDLESIDGNSDVSDFFSEEVSEKLRKKALKAMFLKPEFNIRDGLEDYDDDFSVMKPLTEKVAAGLRNWLDEKDPEEALEQELSQDTVPESKTADSEGTPENPDLSDQPSTQEDLDESLIKAQENNALETNTELNPDIPNISERAITQD
jgi:hypothetical protein